MSMSLLTMLENLEALAKGSDAVLKLLLKMLYKNEIRYNNGEYSSEWEGNSFNLTSNKDLTDGYFGYSLSCF